jgi:non-ribosomal peptide synthetase component E (peptide arylation enzyme)
LYAAWVVKLGYLLLQIAAYRIPGYIRFAEEFPKTPMGKVMKTSLYKALMTEIQQAASAGPVADELN